MQSLAEIFIIDSTSLICSDAGSITIISCYC